MMKESAVCSIRAGEQRLRDEDQRRFDLWDWCTKRSCDRLVVLMLEKNNVCRKWEGSRAAGSGEE